MRCLCLQLCEPSDDEQGCESDPLFDPNSTHGLVVDDELTVYPTHDELAKLHAGYSEPSLKSHGQKRDADLAAALKVVPVTGVNSTTAIYTPSIMDEDRSPIAEEDPEISSEMPKGRESDLTEISPTLDSVVPTISTGVQRDTTDSSLAPRGVQLTKELLSALTSVLQTAVNKSPETSATFSHELWTWDLITTVCFIVTVASAVKTYFSR